VLRDIRDGKFGDYYCRAENSIAIPISGVKSSLPDSNPYDMRLLYVIDTRVVKAEVAWFLRTALP